MRRAAFLDRDGVINVDHAYVSRFEDFDFIDGVLDAARRLVDAGFVLVIVTNQSGIGRGYYTEADFHKLDQAVCAVFAEHGAPISATYFCPHHPTKALPPWKCECNCRKPAPGMILQAAKDLDIDLSQSAMFGDKASDMQAAKAAGVAVRVQLGTDGAADPAEPSPEATHHAKDLLSAVTGPLAELLGQSAQSQGALKKTSPKA